MEIYVVAVFTLMSFQSVWFWLASTLHSRFCSGQSLMWGETDSTGVPTSKFRRLFMGLFDGDTAPEVCDAADESCAVSNSNDGESLVMCLDLLAADKLMFFLTALIAVGIHIWLFRKKSGIQIHDFEKDGLFNLANSAEFQSDPEKRPYTRSTTRALLNSAEKEALKQQKKQKTSDATKSETKHRTK